MRYLKKYESHEDIRSICRKYGIEDYTINDDGSIDVDNLSSEKLTKLPLKFRSVSGVFNCYNNELTSLEGCPKSVGDSFSCSYNNLTSLRGCPKSVGFFHCRVIILERLNFFLDYIGKRTVTEVNGYKCI